VKHFEHLLGQLARAVHRAVADGGEQGLELLLALPRLAELLPQAVVGCLLLLVLLL
jgi:hypothetical protein